SWYGTKFHGRSTANGDRYDLYGMTAAHKTLPIPAYVLVTNLENNRSAVVRVNDRGPFGSNRVIDLSYAAAGKLGFAEKGVAFVEVVAIDVDNWPSRELPQPQAPEPVPPLRAAPPALLPPSAAGADGYLVQVGAFAQRASAEDLRSRLSAVQPHPVSIETTASAPVLYRVRLGPFSDRTRAEQARGEILDTRLIDNARVVEAGAQ